MQVILLEKVENLGNLGDLVNVKAGYARNYLVPYGKAKSATPENLAEFEKRKAEFEKAAKEKLDAATTRALSLEGKTFKVEANAGAEGKLFGSVGPDDIADAITSSGTLVEKKEVRMPEGPLRNLGTFEIGLHLHSDVNVTVFVAVTALEE